MIAMPQPRGLGTDQRYIQNGGDWIANNRDNHWPLEGNGSELCITIKFPTSRILLVWKVTTVGPTTVTTQEAEMGWANYNIMVAWAPSYWHGLILYSAWIRNHMPGKVCIEITSPFLNFNGCTI